MGNGNVDQPMRLGIAGLGTIGMAIARQVDSGKIEGMTLAAVASGNREKAEARMSGFAKPAPVVDIEGLAEASDIVVECAPAAHFADIANATLKRGRTLMTLSVGALLSQFELVDVARTHGGRIMVPTGALLGLDVMRAAAVGTISDVTMVTRKPPGGLKDAPYVLEHDMNLDGLNEAKKLFAGSAREAAKGFPANLNVAAALALSGIGPDRTQVEIWADPEVSRNTHTITVKSDSSDFTMKIENIPTEENPRTGKITALSVIAALQRLTDTLVVGT